MLYAVRSFNFVLKLVWGKHLIRHGEKHGCFGTENHGSRPGRQTIDALLEKLLIYEFARLSRTSLITVDNDAKSCYDRIIRTLAMVAWMAIGLPIAAAMMHNRKHQKMEHHIKSRHGLLRPYFGTEGDELEGTGQGSRASPAIWLILSVSILAAFSHFSPGMKLYSPFEPLLVLSVLATFYADDGMPGVNDATDECAREPAVLLQQTEESAQSWGRLLFASGCAGWSSWV
jgi:hypothetical protein